MTIFFLFVRLNNTMAKTVTIKDLPKIRIPLPKQRNQAFRNKTKYRRKAKNAKDSSESFLISVPPTSFRSSFTSSMETRWQREVAVAAQHQKTARK